MNVVEEKKKFDFKSLTPKSDVNIDIYSEALQFVLAHKDIKNVAITGSYGAGKSSVLESFKRTEQGAKYSYLHISLAHFKQIDENGGEIDEASLERQLEGKIINQLIHKIPEENILDSKVRVRKTINDDEVLLWTFGILVGVLSTVYWSSYVAITEFKTENKWLHHLCQVLIKPELFWVVVLVTLVLLFYLIKYLVTAQMKNKFFKKLCIKNSEIELFGEEDSKEISYFDKYLDEIKYLLINSNTDVFVFEDIDRYGTNLIFEKLREINNIVNENREQPIRFFYLVRDDLFVQKDRTKFFDFIIPIVPVVSGHNSFNIFFEYMGRDGEELSRQFLKQISLYIDDMRILNNIYNEYQIYYDSFKEICIEKSAEQIFALITYKNLFPQDYIKLQNREGYVASVFEELKRRKKSKIDECLSEIEELRKEIENIERIKTDVIAKDLKEINALYINLDEEYSCNDKRARQYKNYAEFVDDLLKNPAAAKYKNGASWYSGETKIRSLIEKMKTSSEYQGRVEEIERKKECLSKDEELFKKRIIELEGEIRNIGMLNLSSYINLYGDIRLFNAEDEEKLSKEGKYYKTISESAYIKLIELLLKNGYIDENYGDYMVVFHKSDITPNDKKFVIAVLENQPLEFDYKLDDPEGVDEYLKVQNLECRAAINSHLFSYYMVNDDSDKKIAIAKPINRYVPVDFIVYMLEKVELAYDLWVNYLNGISESVLEKMLEEETAKDTMDTFMALLLMNSFAYEIELFDDSYKEYMKTKICKDTTIFESIFEHDGEQIDREFKLQRLLNNLSYLEWKIPYFVFDMDKSRDVSEIIYFNDFYELNIGMIKQILAKWYHIDVENNQTHLYENIVTTNKIDGDGGSPLYHYVVENVNQFIDELVDNEIVIDDAPEILLELLFEADNEHQNMLLSKMNNCFDDASILGNIDRLNKVIRYKKLAYKPQNIFKYYDLYMEAKTELEESGEEFKSDDLFIKYINDFPEEGFDILVEDLNIYEQKSEDEQRKIFQKVSRSEELEDTKYRVLVKQLNFVWKTQAPSSVPADKVGILIEEKLIKMTKDVLPGMRERYAGNMRDFILNNIQTYVNEVINDTNFSLAECEMLLEEDILDEYKIKLLSYTKEKISVVFKKYSEDLILYILENNYDKNDLMYIIKQEYENVELQNCINQIAEKNIEAILENHYEIGKMVCKHFLKKDTSVITLVDNKNLLANYLHKFSKEEVRSIMMELQMEDFLPIFKNKNPLIENTEINTRILLEMKECGYVGTFKEDKKAEGYYRVYSKRGG